MQQPYQLRRCMLDRIPAFFPALTVFAENPDPLGTNATLKEKANALLAKSKDVSLQTHQPPATEPADIAEWAQRGLSDQEVAKRFTTKEAQAQYYAQRVDALERQNARLAKSLGFEDAAQALQQQRSELAGRGLVSERFRRPTILNEEGHQLETAKILQTRQAEDLLRHTPMRAMKYLLGNQFVDEIMDRIQDPQLNSRVDVRDVILPPKDHEITGTIKFVGHLKNKGDIQYVGVELDKEFSGYGKNDGDYEGDTYFEVSVKGAGLLLPMHRLLDAPIKKCAEDVASLLQIVRDNHTLLLRLSTKLASSTFSEAAIELARKVMNWYKFSDNEFTLGNAICPCSTLDATAPARHELDSLISKYPSIDKRLALLDVRAYKVIEPKVEQPTKYQGCAPCEVHAELEDLPGTWVNYYAVTAGSTDETAITDAQEDSNAEMADVDTSTTPAITDQRPSRSHAVSCSIKRTGMNGKQCQRCTTHGRHICRLLCRTCKTLVQDEYYDENKKKRGVEQVLRLLPATCPNCIFPQVRHEATDTNDDTTLNFLGRYDFDYISEDDQDFEESDAESSESDGEDRTDKLEPHPPVQAGTKRKRGEKLHTSGKAAETTTKKKGKTAQESKLNIADVVNKETADKYFSDYIQPDLLNSYKRKRLPHTIETAMQAIRNELDKLQAKLEQEDASYLTGIINKVEAFISNATTSGTAAPAPDATTSGTAAPTPDATTTSPPPPKRQKAGQVGEDDRDGNRSDVDMMD